MDIQEFRKELQKLRKELTRHDYRYYILNNPIITDQQYDKMYRKWQDLINSEDTHSLETEGLYPQWVKDEFSGVEPLT